MGQPERETLAELSPAGWRRLGAAGLLAGLGAALAASAVAAPAGNPVLTLASALAGAVAVWQSTRLYRATAQSILLTRAGLEDSRGRVLATWPEIAAVDRGVFAFKPSNGFVVRLKSSHPAAWAPGLWWRFGRTLGIGGTTSGFAARHMADRITILLRNPDERAQAGIVLEGDAVDQGDNRPD